MTSWVRDAGVLWRRSGDRRLLLTPDGDEVVALDGVAALTWDLLEAPVAHAGLVRTLTAGFEVDAATVDDEIRTFLDQLASLGAVERR